MRVESYSYAWYDRLVQLQAGYYYPWKSVIAPHNGEDAYIQLVRENVSQATAVLDVGCGHGEVSVEIACLCAHIVAYDREPSYIDLAQKLARERGITNVAFVCADSSAEANGGHARIPAEDSSFDLIISRRGPLHWIQDARRVARPGAVFMQLMAMDPGVPSWNNLLPKGLRLAAGRTLSDQEEAIEISVGRRLARGGLHLHSWWKYDVAEYLQTPRDLYVYLCWGEDPADVPGFREVEDPLVQIFREQSTSSGLAIRHRRFLWKAGLE
jgi:SAM-dependent methyltransferase